MDTNTEQYRLKKVQIKGKAIPLVMQNINGPCPLLAISNILLLQQKISIHTDYSMVDYAQLVELLGDRLVHQPKPEDKELLDIYNQSVADAISLFPTLQYGLDVNVRFRHITDFEFTLQLSVFDLFNIRLVHGWLVDPQSAERAAMGDLSYNEVVEKLVHLSEMESITTPLSPEEQAQLEQEKKIAEFMRESASQLTPHGLEQLREDVGEGEFCVFFRNNHFSVLHKHEGLLYVLVTDQGYLYQQKIVWELFDSVDGDSLFYGADFQMFTPEDTTPEGIVNLEDAKSDEALAYQLQQEEEQANAAVEQREKDEKEAQLLSDHEMALRMQQELDGGQPMAQELPASQPASSSTAAQPSSSSSSNRPIAGSNLQEVYQQHQPVTPEQTAELNRLLQNQNQQNPDCQLM